MKPSWQKCKDLFKRFNHEPKVKTFEMGLKLHGPEAEKKQRWFSRKQMRQQWLRGFSTSKYRPHQGHQEKARRVRQMARGII